MKSPLSALQAVSKPLSPLLPLRPGPGTEEGTLPGPLLWGKTRGPTAQVVRTPSEWMSGDSNSLKALANELGRLGLRVRSTPDETDPNDLETLKLQLGRLNDAVQKKTPAVRCDELYAPDGGWKQLHSVPAGVSFRSIPFETSLRGAADFTLVPPKFQLQERELSTGFWLAKGDWKQCELTESLGFNRSVYQIPPGSICMSADDADSGKSFRVVFVSLAERNVSAEDRIKAGEEELLLADLLGLKALASDASAQATAKNVKGRLFYSSTFTVTKPGRFSVAEAAGSSEGSGDIIFAVNDSVDCYGATSGSVRPAGESGGAKKPLVLAVEKHADAATDSLRVVGSVDYKIAPHPDHPDAAPLQQATHDKAIASTTTAALYHFSLKGTSSPLYLPAPRKLKQKVNYNDHTFRVTFRLQYNYGTEKCPDWRTCDTKYSSDFVVRRARGLLPLGCHVLTSARHRPAVCTAPDARRRPGALRATARGSAPSPPRSRRSSTWRGS